MATWTIFSFALVLVALAAFALFDSPLSDYGRGVGVLAAASVTGGWRGW
jgi:hypothetical protein